MNDVRIDTPRGITLAGTLQLPAGAAPIDLEVSTTSEDATPPQARPEGVVLLAHDFLTDRHGQGGRLDWIGARYREAGLATLNLDFSGLGESDDDVITLASEAEDLRAASSWLAGLGFTRQMIHANGFGATAALLARQVGDKRAREIFFLARTYDAVAAERWGVVNEAVPHAELEERALEYAATVASKSPQAIRMLKLAFNLADDGLAGQQVFAGEATRLAYMTDEAVEGRDAFLQRRTPDWSPFPYYF